MTDLLILKMCPVCGHDLSVGKRCAVWIKLICPQCLTVVRYAVYVCVTSRPPSATLLDQLTEAVGDLLAELVEPPPPTKGTD